MGVSDSTNPGNPSRALVQERRNEEIPGTAPTAVPGILAVRASGGDAPRGPYVLIE